MNTNNGGYAFPVASPGGARLNEGMTLRDYFAIHAPIAPSDFMMVMVEYPSPDGTKYMARESEIQRQVRFAWAYADAMLAERAK